MIGLVKGRLVRVIRTRTTPNNHVLLGYRYYPTKTGKTYKPFECDGYVSKEGLVETKGNPPNANG